MKNGNFWKYALQGGTVIGGTMIILSLVQLLFKDSQSTGMGIVGTFLAIAKVAAFIFLIYFYTKKISSEADSRIGFSYGKCIGFVLAMMLFTGFLVGIYNFVLNAYVIREQSEMALQMSLSALQNLYTPEQMEMAENVSRVFIFNPIGAVFSGLFGFCLYGMIVGLVTSAFAKRNPDIFSDGQPGDNY